MGTIFNNTLTGKCLGILITADAPGPAGSVSIIRNLVGNNTRACPAIEDEFPAISGLGVVLDGADDVNVFKNIIVGNRPSGPTIASWGRRPRPG